MIQQLGLLPISNAVALHVRDVKQGTMVLPSDDEDGDFDSPHTVPSPLAEAEATNNILEEDVKNGATLFDSNHTTNSLGGVTPSPSGFGDGIGSTTNGSFNHAEFSALGDDCILQQQNIYLAQ